MADARGAPTPSAAAAAEEEPTVEVSKTHYPNGGWMSLFLPRSISSGGVSKPVLLAAYPHIPSTAPSPRLLVTQGSTPTFW